MAYEIQKDCNGVKSSNLILLWVRVIMKSACGKQIANIMPDG